ncbi:kinase domain-containing protein [Aspergillus homomorphus CBS 101889]|uniref:non-specific serine/threonine protein kinase n=1 Tax=Aspergillus homomorphus (strain CBS 101889) TaxID=1450537 RepID=A0A395HSB1_ASPHC|nr:kinase domain-containing protein [Aspergillus homomorphus CBS 101889]RAL10225.1 kinase domain-containing protein [Aspergillus homomorphus CBS 101889]
MTSYSSSTRHSWLQYRLIEGVEDLGRYCPGGYYPLQIGNQLHDGRYQVVDKLGFREYSTIWLARDLQKAKYVAVKVITAEGSSSTRPPAPGREIIPPLLDDFWVLGPNGKHKCIVTLAARMSLFDTKEASTFGLLQPRVAQSIIAQLLRGVAFLHNLHLGNILVDFPEAIDHLSTSELYERYGEPEPEDVARVDGKPLQHGVPARGFLRCWLGVRSNELVLGEDRVTLSDFGFSSKTLPFLQIPEAKFSDAPLSFASDIWTLACTIWEIAGQRPLFDSFWPTADRVTAEQVEALGILPPDWWEKWAERSKWFEGESASELKPAQSRGYGTVLRTWNQRFEYSIQKPRAEAGLEIMSEQERIAFKAMLRSMLIFRPEERATAQEALCSDWMKGWGQPALEQSWNASKSSTKEAQEV